MILKDFYIPDIAAALLTITKINQSTDQLIYLSRTDYQIAIKDKILTFVTPWMVLEDHK